MPSSFQVETAVKARYSAASQFRVEALCCPVQYDDRFLKVIPKEILERDYGCGDPSRYLIPGETVLDLGAGAGKICFIASQVVGPKGRVIGVDMNDDMLALARSHQKGVGEAIGWQNVEFRKGRIQDLALDLDRLDAALRLRPIDGASAFVAAEALAEELRHTQPLVGDASVDVVVSNCVLNLVSPRDKGRLFNELFRVLRDGGRAVISDIVCDEEVPKELQEDPELWSGCISGALTEEGFLGAFLQAGFHGLEILKRDVQPWRTVRGIEFRSVTVRAYKGAAPSPSPADCNQAVVYRGPFAEVLDDAGRRFFRGVRQAVSAEAYEGLQRPPYRDLFEFIEPQVAVPRESAPRFGARAGARRDPRATKGEGYRETTPEADCCGGGGATDASRCC